MHEIFLFLFYCFLSKYQFFSDETFQQEKDEFDQMPIPEERITRKNPDCNNTNLKLNNILRHVKAKSCQAFYTDHDVEHFKIQSLKCQRSNELKRKKSLYNYDQLKRRKTHLETYSPEKMKEKYSPEKRHKIYKETYSPEKSKEKYIPEKRHTIHMETYSPEKRHKIHTETYSPEKRHKIHKEAYNQEKNKETYNPSKRHKVHEEKYSPEKRHKIHEETYSQEKNKETYDPEKRHKLYKENSQELQKKYTEKKHEEIPFQVRLRVFRHECHFGPIFTCICCIRNLFQRGVIKFEDTESICKKGVKKVYIDEYLEKTEAADIPLIEIDGSQHCSK